MSEFNNDKITAICSKFCIQGNVVDQRRHGSGHINDTFLITTDDKGQEHKYILQRINHEIFKDINALMKNISGVTTFLREMIIKEGGNPDRETLNLVSTKDGEVYFQDEEGGYYRMYLFISGATCYDIVEKPEDFYESGKAFGRFQGLLADYPAKELTETIPNFHNTPDRLIIFKKAVEEDICGRRDSVMKEIQFFLDREADMKAAMDMLEKGELPLRVTHNDTKLNNIMIDDKTGKAICVIDLDTIMPGLSMFDFGDAIRFGANTALEDETDLSKVSLSLPLFEIYVKGFMEGCKGGLTKKEIEMLPMGAKLMTLECGMRFLTDYLQGDHYFKIHREGHNLDRTRTQIGLVADMEKKWEDMGNIVKEYL